MHAGERFKQVQVQSPRPFAYFCQGAPILVFLAEFQVILQHYKLSQG